MKAAVTDASVAIKWVFEEEHSDRALNVLRDVPTLHAPAHWLAEAATGLWSKSAIHGLLTVAEFEERLALLTSLPIVVAPLHGIIATAGLLALELRLTAYDTLYLALAEQLDLPLVTADRRLHERAAGQARFASRLRWIGDMPTGDG